MEHLDASHALRAAPGTRPVEEGIRAWLSEPGPALLHIKVEPMELVMPPAVEAGPAVGMALYAARAVLQGKGGDLLEMIEENI